MRKAAWVLLPLLLIAPSAVARTELRFPAGQESDVIAGGTATVPFQIHETVSGLTCSAQPRPYTVQAYYRTPDNPLWWETQPEVRLDPEYFEMPGTCGQYPRDGNLHVTFKSPQARGYFSLEFAAGDSGWERIALHVDVEDSERSGLKDSSVASVHWVERLDVAIGLASIVLSAGGSLFYVRQRRASRRR